LDSLDGLEGIHTKTYSIAPGVWTYRSTVPDGWRPDLTLPLDEAMPHPWTEKYVRVYKQPFVPHGFMGNAVALAGYFESTDSPDAVVLQRRLLARMLDFSFEREGARFLLYRFAKAYRAARLGNPWTSGYASGAALIGLTAMMAMRVEGAAEIAREVLYGLARPVRLSDDRSGHWVSLVDDDGFLWFEEVPLATRPSHILNGHIRALLGLYTYFSTTGDRLALSLLRAGLATIEANALRFRVPGKINRYDLLEPYMADYSPERTWGQQHVLSRISGETAFAHYRDVFRADILRDPAYVPAGAEAAA
jgi:hypothetical protein